jgi:hypothetical protein
MSRKDNEPWDRDNVFDDWVRNGNDIQPTNLAVTR